MAGAVAETTAQSILMKASTDIEGIVEADESMRSNMHREENVILQAIALVDTTSFHNFKCVIIIIHASFVYIYRVSSA